MAAAGGCRGIWAMTCGNSSGSQMGHTIVMGRKTWESSGRPLPGRRMVVISRQPGYHAAGADVVSNLDRAVEVAAAAGDEEVFVIGGAEIYRLALPRADRLYLTRVHATLDGDALFPAVDWSPWKLVESNRHAASDRNNHAFTLERYDRV